MPKRRPAGTVSGLPRGTEALVRWQHPERGLVAPLDFIPIAEETGLIVDLGRWVLETACEQGAAWQRQFGCPLKMFVNVSGRQVADPMFATEVAEIVNRTGLRPKTLGLEVTESVLIHEAGARATCSRTPRPADDIDPFLEQLLRPLITARSVQPPM